MSWGTEIAKIVKKTFLMYNLTLQNTASLHKLNAGKYSTLRMTFSLSPDEK